MAYAMGLKRKAQEEAAAVAAVTSSRSSHAAMTEDEQIAMALAMSMQREVSKDKTAGDGPSFCRDPEGSRWTYTVPAALPIGAPLPDTLI